METGSACASVWTLGFAKGKLPRDFVEGSPVASNGGVVDIPMIYSVIDIGGDVILVDTGFAPGGISMTGRQFADVETPAETLEKVGFAPSDVTTIVLTHIHFDHAGQLDAYPNARIFVQAREAEGWRHVLARLGDAPSSKQRWALSSFNPADMDALARADAEGRVVYLDGDHELAAGLTLRLAADTHTFGSQWVEIAGDDGPHVLAGDSVVTYANLERLWPPGYHQGNAWRLVETYEHLSALVGGHLERIVVGHDMRIFNRPTSWIAGRNPVLELKLASGAQSRRPEEMR